MLQPLIQTFLNPIWGRDPTSRRLGDAQLCDGRNERYRPASGDEETAAACSPSLGIPTSTSYAWNVSIWQTNHRIGVAIRRSPIALGMVSDPFAASASTF